MTPAVKTAGPENPSANPTHHVFSPTSVWNSQKPAWVGGPLCVAAARSASWLAERERESACSFAPRPCHSCFAFLLPAA